MHNETKEEISKDGKTKTVYSGEAFEKWHYCTACNTASAGEVQKHKIAEQGFCPSCGASTQEHMEWDVIGHRVWIYTFKKTWFGNWIEVKKEPYFERSGEDKRAVLTAEQRDLLQNFSREELQEIAEEAALRRRLEERSP